jgi:hypothetical protein
MTDDQTPETPSELAMRLWETAIQHLDQAANEENVDLSNAYVGIGQLSLMAAQFALNNQAFLMGIPVEMPSDPSQFGLPPALPEHLQSQMPPGAPPLPTWGRQA